MGYSPPCEGLQLQVVVNNPPDLADANQRSHFDRMVAAFEDTEFTMRRNATMFWLYAFDAQLRQDLVERNISLPEKSNNLSLVEFDCIFQQCGMVPPLQGLAVGGRGTPPLGAGHGLGRVGRAGGSATVEGIPFPNWSQKLSDTNRAHRW